MASTVCQLCSSSFTSVGVPLTTIRGPISLHRRANCSSPRSLLVFQSGDECSVSTVHYDDVTSQWLSADFLDLRLRSSGLICKEAGQALQNHFQKDKKQHSDAAATVTLSTDTHHVE